MSTDAMAGGKAWSAERIFDRDQRPEIAANFVSIQEAVDAVDRALADERGG